MLVGAVPIEPDALGAVPIAALATGALPSIAPTRATPGETGEDGPELVLDKPALDKPASVPIFPLAAMVV